MTFLIIIYLARITHSVVIFHNFRLNKLAFNYKDIPSFPLLIKAIQHCNLPTIHHV